LGGYHAAKPARMQELYDFYLEKGKLEVFNMFNVKYFLEQDEEGKVLASENPMANGNAWFINEVKMVETADEELLTIENTNTKQTAIVHREFEGLVTSQKFTTDTLSTIKLIEVKPDYLYYETENTSPGLAVFSELYYPHGWNAYINGKEAEHFRANY